LVVVGEYVLNENDAWVPATNDDLDVFFDEEEEQDDEDLGDDTARDFMG
jgi:hypothetical protein